jgi:hypothetical protein
VDLFGRAVRPIADKFEALAPYRYSLAVENTKGPDYWTEKLADCFLTWTVPLYHGCTNVHRYFPEDSLVPIDIDRPEEAFDLLRRVQREPDWHRRLPALAEARKRVLERYQLMAHASDLIRRHGGAETEPDDVVLPPYRRSRSASARRFLYKLRRRLRFSV